MIYLLFLITSYLENKISSQKEEERFFFHLLQFLPFFKTLKTDEGYKKHWIKNKLYYMVKFALSQFVNFTGIKMTSNYQWKKILFYFKRF